MNDTKVISVSCQKGGVGKTLVSLNLSYALSKLGYKVLLIDMDPQASASLLLNIDIGDDEMPGIASIFEYVMYCLKERAEIDPDILKKCINRPTYTIPVRKNKTYVSENVEFGFDLIPSSIELANYDILLNNFDIAGMKFGGYVMQQIIKVFKKNFDYDFIIFDVLPGLNMLAYNALAAATDGNIMPINMDKSAITGGENLLNCITQIQKYLWNGNQKIKHNGILGVVKNEYKPKLKVTKALNDNLFNYFGPAHIFKTTIPTKASCDNAHEKGRMYAEFDKSVGQVFEQLALEVIDECNKRAKEEKPVFIEKFGKSYLEEQEK